MYFLNIVKREVNIWKVMCVFLVNWLHYMCNFCSTKAKIMQGGGFEVMVEERRREEGEIW